MGKVKKILAEKDITLEINVLSDYVVPNNVVDSGSCRKWNNSRSDAAEEEQ